MRLRTVHRNAVSRFFRPMGRALMSVALVAALIAALLAPAAQAGVSQKSLSKKQSPSATGSKGNRGSATATRKAAAHAGAVRASAKTARMPARPAFVPARPSFGQIAGLHGVNDPLALRSSVALVVDQDTHEVLLSKNDHAVLPIASLTKLMTGLLISQAQLPMDELLTITQDDVDMEKGSRSRLTVGTTLTRGAMLHLALMASENRAAHALGRTYPGGLAAFVAQMNAQARWLGMTDTHYAEPTGLSSRNQSSARDLATLVNVAHADPLLRELSTSPGYEVAVGRKTLQYNNTNRLVKNPTWDIGLQKTGYISEAGRCLVMQAQVAGRKLIMVFLDSAGKFSRLADAERVRHWIESMPSLTAPARSSSG
ncbi:serine hydrolase [Verminephrobacter eiseniae]|uniref:serine hydrolase n=1 Tax=Verminephrobacter eiseniae TaxID=364317 RepID=UPI00223878F8|nr:serine hydrolase [Verminephrobacter eiseniae]MCW5237683.1 peptidase S11 [Verminephrobacter eiseniae]